MKDINSHFTEDTQFSVPKNKEEEDAAVVTLNFFSIPISYSLKVNEKGINQKYKLLKPQKFLLFFITEPHKLTPQKVQTFYAQGSIISHTS